MTKQEQRLQKMTKEIKVLAKKVATEKKNNREEFLRLLGKSYMEKIKSSKNNEDIFHSKEWRKEKISKISSLLTAKEQEWIKEQLDEELFNLDVKP